MITLTVNPDQEHRKYSFSEGKVSIGCIADSTTSLKLVREQTQDVHVQIVKEGSKYYTYNSANDPFVTLNDIPFGKREIKEGDTLQIGKTLILFHLDNSKINETDKPKEQSNQSCNSTKDLTSILDEKITPSEQLTDTTDSNAKSPSKNCFMKESPVKQEEEVDDTLQQIQDYLKTLSPDNIPSLTEKATQSNNDADNTTSFEKTDEFDDIDIESLVKEVEKLKVPNECEDLNERSGGEFIEPNFDDHKELPPKENKEPFKNQPKEVHSRANKSKPQSNHDSIPQQVASQFMLPQEDPKPTKVKSNSKTVKWKLWVALFFIAFGVISLIFSGVYSRLQEASTQSELDAAREVSDIALALTYAHINHIQPQRQNWTDPMFLTNSIRAVLGGQHKPNGSIDTNGRMIDGKYLLRIYNKGDMSRFIVIAQPEASLTQWLAPQRAIVIDSTDMVLHRVSDLRPLNRLLVNVDSLSGENGKALHELIKGEEVIKLSTLSDKNNKNGFAPPKQLELMKIGAENYVYNAPRYSQIGEKIMELAIDLVSRPGSSTEFKKLEEEAKLIGKLPDAVMYTSKGMKAALKAQKALITLLPNQSFLIGYLQVDEQGNMKGSHLIFDLEAPKRQQNPNNDHFQGMVHQSSNDMGGYQPLVLAANASEYLHPHMQSKSHLGSASFNPKVDTDSPLYLQITALAKERQDKLQVFGRSIIDLIHKNNNEYVENFPIEMEKLIKEYQAESNIQNEQVVQKLGELYREYDFMPMSEFSEYVESAGLNHIAQSHLKEVSDKKEASSLFNEKKFHDVLTSINKATSIEELHRYVAETSKNLRLENIPNTRKLISYQNSLRTHVLQTLNELLLSPDRDLPPGELTRENRMR
ncbi:MAG: hypothetical protein AAGG81_09180, partial [Chlamydiota bacterium]